MKLVGTDTKRIVEWASILLKDRSAYQAMSMIQIRMATVRLLAV